MESKSRVLIFVNSLSAGGAERVTLGLFNYLIEQGRDAYLFVTYWQESSARVYGVGHPDRVFHSPRISNSRIRSFANLVLLRRVIKRVKPTVVISLGCSYRLIEAAGLFGSAKVILSERNWPPAYYSDAGEAVRFFYEKADCVVFQTEDARDCFSGLSYCPVIPNPVSLSRNRWIGQESSSIVYFGRLDRQKRPEVALEAFGLFLNEHPDFHMDYYGIGTGLPYLKERAVELGISSRVSFHPPSSDIHEIASRAFMFVNSSDYEGISNSMLEALSIGIPCVCTDCDGGGARLVIEDGVNGMLVNKGDWVAMASAMSVLADSRELAESISKRAIESIGRFHPELIYSEWQEAIDGLTIL